MPRERKGALKAKSASVDVAVDGGEQSVLAAGGGKAKKRRSSLAGGGNGSQTSSSVQTAAAPVNSDLAPPIPSSTYGDTIVAANPFDDAPTTHSHSSQPSTPNAVPSSQPPPSSQAPSSQVQQQQQQQQAQQPPLNGPVAAGQPQPPPPPGSAPQSQPPPSQSQSQKPVPMLSGKIYPVDQSMVFNPANPNAPPIYPCGICHKEVHDNDQAIFCESGCNFCFHRSCTGLTEYAFHLLAAEVFAEWVCDKCLQTKKIPLVKFKP